MLVHIHVHNVYITTYHIQAIALINYTNIKEVPVKMAHKITVIQHRDGPII